MLIKLEKQISIGQHGIEMTSLPKGHWTLNFDPQQGYSFREKVEPTPIKFDEDSLANRASKLSKDYINTSSRNTNGIMFSGTSGMGKTQAVYDLARELDVPCVHISSPYNGKSLIAVVEECNTDVIIFFDEFEKVYAEQETVESLLTLFDGASFPFKVTFLVCYNETRNISDYMYNRPGRFVFNFQFVPLTTEKAFAYLKTLVDVSDELGSRIMYFFDNVSMLTYDIVTMISKIIKENPVACVDMLQHMNLTRSENTYTLGLYFREGEHNKINCIASIQIDPEHYDDSDVTTSEDFNFDVQTFKLFQNNDDVLETLKNYNVNTGGYDSNINVDISTGDLMKAIRNNSLVLDACITGAYSNLRHAILRRADENTPLDEKNAAAKFVEEAFNKIMYTNEVTTKNINSNDKTLCLIVTKEKKNTTYSSKNIAF